MPRVEIVPSRGTWAGEFRSIAGAIRAGLGPLALRIDHIGSTSVPALASKDVIDVQVTVATLDCERLVPPFAGAGFRQRADVLHDHRPPGAEGPEADWAKLYFQPGRGGRRTHVHVRAAGRPNQRYALLFRDYLRAHPEAVEAYAALKRRLAALQLDGAAYTDVKDPVCDLIVVAAEAWATHTGWQPGPSDS